MKIFSFLFLFLVTALLSPSALAVSKGKKAGWKKGYYQNDWQIGYGFKSCIMTVDALADVEMSDVTQSNVVTENRKSIGALTAQFTHRAGQKVSFGLAFTYEQTTEDCIVKIRNYESKVGELTNRYFTATPLLRFNWVEGNLVMFYSKLAVGLTFIGDSFDNIAEEPYDIQSQKQHYFGYQISPVGLVIGRKLCGFIEAGYGSHGLVQAGLTYRF
ncbi:MAG: hypothetical protein SOY07_09235 [Bacteroidales bacterium]|nr:hypothetical protein [Bacteroidales bacterium]MDY4175456.1 hypothetical protein [Bacteroidales bacterium]